MAILQGLQGGLSGAASGSAFGPAGAVIGGAIGMGAGLFSASQQEDRREALKGDFSDLAANREQMIGEQLELDRFQRDRQRLQTRRNAAIAESRVRAASVLRGVGLDSSVTRQAQEAGAAQRAESMRDIDRGREATESQLALQRREQEIRSRMQTR